VRGARAALALRLAIGLGCGAGCAAQPPSPFFNDERFLVLGVDPNAEVDALARQLETSGFTIVRRLHGQHFGALGAASADGRPVKVRVVTARGIALALDPNERDLTQPPRRYALLPPPSSETHDADGDGFEEVFVHVLPEAGDAPCIRVYRVRDSGFVDEVASSGAFTPSAEAASSDPAWREPRFCPEIGADGGRTDPTDGGAATPTPNSGSAARDAGAAAPTGAAGSPPSR
jgi:hypothetical protein